MQKTSTKNFIPDITVVEVRNRLGSVRSKLDEELTLVDVPIKALLSETLEVIDFLRDYGFASDLNIQHWQDKYDVDGRTMGAEIQKLLNQVRLRDEALESAKAELEKLTELNNELETDKITYRNVVQDMLD